MTGSPPAFFAADASPKTLLIDFGSAAMHGILLAGYFMSFGWNGFKCHYLGDGLLQVRRLLSCYNL